LALLCFKLPALTPSRLLFGLPCCSYSKEIEDADFIETLEPTQGGRRAQSALLEDEAHHMLEPDAVEGDEIGQAGGGPLDQVQLLAALGGSHLTSYMGTLVPGWEQRPKVGSST
jgi:hypothetical protein